VLTDGLAVAQVMVLLQQAVEQRLLAAAPHLAQFDGSKFGQARVQWLITHLHQRPGAPLRQRIDMARSAPAATRCGPRDAA